MSIGEGLLEEGWLWQGNEENVLQLSEKHVLSRWYLLIRIGFWSFYRFL